MAPLVLVRTSATDLARNRLRTFLAALGVLIGVAAVVAMDAIGRGTHAEIDRYLTAIGSNVLVVMPDSLRVGGVQQAAGSALSLPEDDARAIATEVDGVLAAAPIVRRTAQLDAAERNWSTIVYVTTNAYFAAREWQVEAGRDFESDDL